MFKEIINWSYYEITPFWVKAGFSFGIGIEWVQLSAYLPGLVFQPLTGLLCDRFGSKRMALFTLLLCGVGISLLAIPHFSCILFGLIFFGIGMSSSTVANEAFMASLGRSHERPLIYGIVLSLALGVGGLLGGLSGLLVDCFGKQVVTGYSLWFLIMACSIILSLTSYLFIKKGD